MAGGKSSLLCFQRLSASHYDITFKEGYETQRDLLLHNGISLAGQHIDVFESDPKSVWVTMKNLPAAVPNTKVLPNLLPYGEVLHSKIVKDEDDL